MYFWLQNANSFAGVRIFKRNKMPFPSTMMCCTLRQLLKNYSMFPLWVFLIILLAYLFKALYFILCLCVNRITDQQMGWSGRNVSLHLGHLCWCNLGHSTKNRKKAVGARQRTLHGAKPLCLTKRNQAFTISLGKLSVVFCLVLSITSEFSSFCPVLTKGIGATETAQHSARTELRK